MIWHDAMRTRKCRVQFRPLPGLRFYLFLEAQNLRLLSLGLTSNFVTIKPDCERSVCPFWQRLRGGHSPG